MTNDTICYHRKLWSDETENGFLFLCDRRPNIGTLGKNNTQLKGMLQKQTNTIFKFCNNNTVAFPELLDYVYDEKPLRTKV